MGEGCCGLKWTRLLASNNFPEPLPHLQNTAGTQNPAPVGVLNWLKIPSHSVGEQKAVHKTIVFVGILIALVVHL